MKTKYHLAPGSRMPRKSGKLSSYYVESLDRAMEGDPKALIELSEAVENLEDEAEAELISGELDRVSLFYALGSPLDQDREWNEFREIVSYYRKLENHQTGVVEAEEALGRSQFDLKVLESMQVNENDNERKLELQYVIDAVRMMVGQAENDLKEHKEGVEFTQSWLDEARKALRHPRFTALPEQIFEELVEAVSYRLDDIEPRVLSENSDSECDCGEYK